MSVHEQERPAKLMPVVLSIFACGALIMVGGYFVGNYMF